MRKHNHTEPESAVPPGCCGTPTPAPVSRPPEADPSHSAATPDQPADCGCAPKGMPSGCGPPSAANATGCQEFRAERPGYRIWPFVEGWLETPVGQVPMVKTRLAPMDTLGRWQMRWGFGRLRYQIAPGVYAAGRPTPASPVLVSANYKLSFDALRSQLNGLDAWILVIDTKGINVWCAAGKGTFGTAEIAHRVKRVGLAKLVDHRVLVLPQLGAPGVAAHEVHRTCGFRVEYGPVRAADIGEFLAAGMQASPAMRRVTFATLDRLVLTPVELAGLFKTTLWIALALFVLGGIGPGFFSFSAAIQRGTAAFLVYLAGILSGAVLVPTLLPWVPGRAFALKGALAGILVALIALMTAGGGLSLLNGLALLVALPALASYCSMNFTGSTTFTSPSGVEKEMRRAIPLQATALLVATICWIASAFY